MTTEIQKLRIELKKKEELAKKNALHKKGVEFFLAARDGDLETLQSLLKEGVPVDSLFTNHLVWNPPFASGGGRTVFTTWYHAGATALMIAAYHGHLKAVEILLENGAEVNVKDEALQTPLIAAVSRQYANPKIVQLLLQKGADIRAEYQNKEFSKNVFHIAAEHKNAECMEFLIAHLMAEKETQQLLNDIASFKEGMKNQEKNIATLENEPEKQKRELEKLQTMKAELKGKQELLDKRLAVLNSLDRTRGECRRTPLGYALSGVAYAEGWGITADRLRGIGRYGFLNDLSPAALNRLEKITCLLLECRADIDCVLDETGLPRMLNSVIKEEISLRAELEFYKRTGKVFVDENDLERFKAIRADLVGPLESLLPKPENQNILEQAFGALCELLPFQAEVLGVIVGYIRNISHNPDVQEDLERLNQQRFLRFTSTDRSKDTRNPEEDDWVEMTEEVSRGNVKKFE